MANTTFSGAVRSENGFSDITKNSTTGSITSTMTLSTYEATITVADGATTGKEAAIGIPSNFIPMGVLVAVTTAAANSVNLNDIGTDADTDGFVDGISAAVNSTGFKGFFPLQWRSRDVRWHNHCVYRNSRRSRDCAFWRSGWRHSCCPQVFRHLYHFRRIIN